MTLSINKAIILGYVGSSPEFHTMKERDGEFVTFSVATTEKWKDKNTKLSKYNTDWHKIVIFQKSLINLSKKYIKVGSRIYLEGKIKNREYILGSGSKKKSSEIVINSLYDNLIILDNIGIKNKNNINTEFLIDNSNNNTNSINNNSVGVKNKNNIFEDNLNKKSDDLKEDNLADVPF